MYVLIRLGEAVQHHANGGDANAGLAAPNVLLVVLAQPPVGAQPGESPLHDPAFLLIIPQFGERPKACESQREKRPPTGCEASCCDSSAGSDVPQGSASR